MNRHAAWTALSLAFGLAPLGAEAAPLTAAQAEHRRLADEMLRLAARNAWKGVEADYQALLALEGQPGVELSHHDHLLGAQAARDAGRAADVRDRLRKAQARLATPEVKAWLADLEQGYGAAQLSADEGVEARLVAADPPLEPDRRAALAYAQGALTLHRQFDGLLPRGAYTLNGQAFVVGGEATVSVHVLPSEGAGPSATEPSGNGMRLFMGPSALRLGEGSGAAGVQGDALGGAGLRASLGGEVAISERLGAFAEGGYQGIVGGADGGARGDDTGAGSLLQSPVYEAPNERLHLGWAWAGLSLQHPRGSLAVGPLWMGGNAIVHGAQGACEGVEVCANEELLTEAPVEGTFLAGGVGLGLFVPVLRGPAFGSTFLGLRLDAGLVSDTERRLGYGALGVCLSPR